MKVLFAVNNENISTLIVKKYQNEYKEIISYKNVYYFNAILKEIQKDKSYDRIIISEDLEQFTNSNYQQMDKFIFDRLDSISDEASNMQGENIPIILICSERRSKGEDILVKLFGIGIYDAVIGKDRDIKEVCNLINRPRTKKEAKEYYRIDAEDVSYQAENENDVSEVEIQNILAHYKRLGKNEERYVESFDNIALQYNDIQLKIICKFLPLNVRAVLEEKSARYQKLMSFNKSVSNVLRTKEKEKQSGTSEKLLVNSNNKQPLSKPVVIPTTVKAGEVKKLTKTQKNIAEPIIRNDMQENQNIEAKEIQPIENLKLEEPKRGRGRPKKQPTEEKTALEEKENQPKRGRGRPKKVETIIQSVGESSVSKNYEEQLDDILPGMEDFDNIDNTPTEAILPGMEDFDIIEDIEKETILPGMEDFDSIDNITKSTNKKEETILPGIENDELEDEEDIFQLPGFEEETPVNNNKSLFTEYEKKPMIITNKDEYSNIDLSRLLTRDKKIVTFVGTSKNGTSFILNNLAELLSSQGINVAILDTTQNRNSYYIYTKNEEQLRKTAFNSIRNLTTGVANGIRVNNNLTVYTSLPSENDEVEQVEPILETLLKNHSLILIDCDFKTPLEYFKNSQEMYLIQSMDVLTIQPLTAFLRELKAKNILEQSKIRIIINKYIKLRNVTEKSIIGGMAYYNDPAMSFMTELFDRNTVKYLTVPFENEIYSRYLEGIINCDISLKGYSKLFMQTLKQIGNSVYPLISGKIGYEPATNKYQPNSGFNPSINNTLNQMKKNY